MRDDEEFFRSLSETTDQDQVKESMGQFTAMLRTEYTMLMAKGFTRGQAFELVKQHHFIVITAMIESLKGGK